MRARFAVALCVAALAMAGCGSGQGRPGIDRPPTSEADISMPSASAPATPAVHKLGETVEVVGEHGNPLKITPRGVYFTKGLAGYGKAENGIFIAIAYRAEAVDYAEGVPEPISGAGWVWRGYGQTITTTEGAAASPPWSGRVNEPITGQDVQPGEFQDYIETFDVPKAGGQLVYINPGTGKQTRWQLPADTAGTGYGPVVHALKVLKG